MSSNHEKGVSIDTPWRFAPHSQLSDDDPDWIIRGIWYDGYDGDFIVVTFRFCDSPRGWEAKITRWVQRDLAEAHFTHIAKHALGGGCIEGVYLFERETLIKHSGSKFDEYTGEKELPDGRWYHGGQTE
jgi:hypothetical protein